MDLWWGVKSTVHGCTFYCYGFYWEKNIYGQNFVHSFYYFLATDKNCSNLYNDILADGYMCNDIIRFCSSFPQQTITTISYKQQT